MSGCVGQHVSGGGFGQSVTVPGGGSGGANGSLAVHDSVPFAQTGLPIGGAPNGFTTIASAEIVTKAANSKLWIFGSWNGVWSGASNNIYWHLVLDNAIAQLGVSPSLGDVQYSSGFLTAVVAVTAGLHRVGLQWNIVGGAFVIDPAAAGIFAANNQQGMIYVREEPS